MRRTGAVEIFVGRIELVLLMRGPGNYIANWPAMARSKQQEEESNVVQVFECSLVKIMFGHK